MKESEQNRIEKIVSEQMDFPPEGAREEMIDMSSKTFCMLGHAHIDLGYRWDFKETIHRVAPWTFEGVLDVMERNPGFTFCQSQMYLYDAVRREYPLIFQKIVSWIEKGNWEVIGGSWSEYDAMLPSGESIIRQYLVGHGFAKKMFGMKPHPVAFVPDSFIGHAETLPQILSGCGIRYYVFCRGLPKDPETGRAETRVFKWVGPDGSALLAYRPVGNYSTPALTEDQLARLSPYLAISSTDNELVLYGTGDHGGGPRDEDMDALRNAGSIQGAPAWEFSRADHFFSRLERELGERFPNDSLPEFRGTMEAFATGALTSQAASKRNNRICERSVLSAERAVTVSTFLQRKPCFPRVDFQEVWRDLLTLQFHDILPGTSVAAVYRDADLMYEKIKERTTQMLIDAIVRICSRIDTGGTQHGTAGGSSGGVSRAADDAAGGASRGPACIGPANRSCPLFVFNPGTVPLNTCISMPYPKERFGWMEDFSNKSEQFSLLGPDGAAVEAFFGKEALHFPAQLPPLGYALYRLIRDDGNGKTTPEPTTTLGFESGKVENRFFTVSFSPENGNLTSIIDKRTGEELLEDESNVPELYDENELATSWVRVIEGPPRKLRQLRPLHLKDATPYSLTVSSTCASDFACVTRELTFYNDIERIDCRLLVEWHESNAFLKLGFSPALDRPSVVTSLPYGTTAVTTPEREFAMQDWVDIHDESRGLAVITDGASGADVEGGRLRVSVMRNVRDMDPAMSHGKHELSYCLYPHGVTEGGTPRVAEITTAAKQFLIDTYSLWDSEHPGGIMNWDHYSIDTSVPLEKSGSFVEVRSDTVFLETVKMVEEEYTPAGIVLRLREVEGKKSKAEVTLPFIPSEVLKADHLERPEGAAGPAEEGSAENSGPAAKRFPFHNRVVTVELSPYELCTVVARMDNPTML